MSAEVSQLPQDAPESSPGYVRSPGNDEDGDVIMRTEEEYAEMAVTLRAIVSSKEAGVIIGKGGKNVAELRERTDVRAGVSKVVPGVHDRVLTITGPLAGTAKAYGIVANGLLEGAPQMGMGGAINSNGTHRKCSGPSG
jgi:heterogeneous nuclear rnp K-like protein